MEEKKRRILGERVEGTRHDRKNKDSGWKTRGTAISLEDGKYLIQGQNYIFNPTGEYEVSGSGDWFSADQIELEAD